MMYLKVNEFSQLCGVSCQTLRLYDRKGLFSPVYVDKSTGYRYYTSDQVLQMDFIQYLKFLGMKLTDIKAQLISTDSDTIRTLMIQRGARIDEEIKGLAYQQEFINRTLALEELHQRPPLLYTPIFEYIPKRYIFTNESSRNIYDGSDTNAYEQALHHLRIEIRKHGIEYYFFNNNGGIIKEEDFVSGNYYSQTVFALMSEQSELLPLFHALPSNNYLSIYCDDFYREHECFELLREKIKEWNLLVVGDYLCEDLAAIPRLLGKQREHFFRVQIPVQPKQK